MEFKVGQSFRTLLPSHHKSVKVHIDHVLPSKVYSDQTLIVLRWYGKYKQWWHHQLIEEDNLRWYVDRYNKENK